MVVSHSTPTPPTEGVEGGGAEGIAKDFQIQAIGRGLPAQQQTATRAVPQHHQSAEENKTARLFPGCQRTLAEEDSRGRNSLKGSTLCQKSSTAREVAVSSIPWGQMKGLADDKWAQEKQRVEMENVFVIDNVLWLMTV